MQRSNQLHMKSRLALCHRLFLCALGNDGNRRRLPIPPI
jgi:hypothetical protein